MDDFDGYIKDMAKDSDYKFSLQFEVSLGELCPFRSDVPRPAFCRCELCVACSCALCCLMVLLLDGSASPPVLQHLKGDLGVIKDCI